MGFGGLPGVRDSGHQTWDWYYTYYNDLLCQVLTFYTSKRPLKRRQGHQLFLMGFSTGLQHHPQFPGAASFVTLVQLRTWFNSGGQWLAGVSMSQASPSLGRWLAACASWAGRQIICSIHPLYLQNSLKPLSGFQIMVLVSLLQLKMSQINLKKKKKVLCLIQHFN